MSLNSPNSSFLQALLLPPDLTEEACTRATSELILLAIKEQPDSVSLKDIHEAVARYDGAAYLEPLDILPALLSYRQDAAMELIRICALHASPKEVTIVIQEAVESLQTQMSDDVNDESKEGNENEHDMMHRIICIVSLCSPAISRSKVGKRSALELCSPLLESVTLLISSVPPFETKEQGRVLITEVAHLVKSLSVWAAAVADASEQQEIRKILRELLDTTVTTCCPSIQASLAIRAAESYFPRFFVKSSAMEGWQDGENAMLQVQLALESLKCFPKAILEKPGSFSDLVYLAHSTPPVALTPSVLSDLHRLLASALQMNMVVDESLFLLFRILSEEGVIVPPTIAMSLCIIFAALASTHLDPTVRQLNLRFLSLTLSKLPPPPRIEILLMLTTNEEFPQIRGPAIGLVKEAVLEALALPPEHAYGNPFASPELLRIFGGVLFRPNPPEFFDEKKTREELSQSLELLRIADCLAFYYVLLQRDRDNKTGVRSNDNITDVQRSLLFPLRQFVNERVTGEEQPLMAVLSLQVGLDRIDSALRTLGNYGDS
ncbi:hypothetical protein JVU11DRAFT_8026 [Chiua virens]|nr:hypothetical protein JVU11DRAFT_8026 [Chiua virens]